MRSVAVFCAALACAGPARADGYGDGSDRTALLIDGALAVLGAPQTLLPLLALGLLVSLWHAQGLLRIWPNLLAGQAIGIALAPVVGDWIVPTLLGAGVIVATLAALLPRHVPAEVVAAGLLLGVLVMAAAFAGHGVREVPVATYLGALLAANIAFAWSAGIAAIAIDQVKASWMPVLWRIVASWIAAILVLVLAFTVSTA